MQTWLTADYHLGETRFEIMQRPFKSPEEYINYLIGCHNELVQPDDLVYVIGDVLYQKADFEQYLPDIDRFNGRKILIRGNHDIPVSDEQFTPYFEQIIENGDGLEVDFEGIPCYLTHYPSQGKKDRLNLVGHIHAAWKFQLNCINVGVDVHHFRPMNANQIPFFLKAITEFYDKDVWCAYDDFNQSHYAQRGKKSSYFQKT